MAASAVKKGIFIDNGIGSLCLAVKSVSAILCVQDNTRFTNNNNIVMLAISLLHADSLRTLPHSYFSMKI